MPAAAPTVADVARAAGVSTATVSRALNQPGSVRPALRDQVLAAVAAWATWRMPARAR
jgi:DNA-binding LacI/PurR family transcriptional regulator